MFGGQPPARRAAVPVPAQLVDVGDATLSAAASLRRVDGYGRLPQPASRRLTVASETPSSAGRLLLAEAGVQAQDAQPRRRPAPRPWGPTGVW